MWCDFLHRWHFYSWKCCHSLIFEYKFSRFLKITVEKKVFETLKQFDVTVNYSKSNISWHQWNNFHVAPVNSSQSKTASYVSFFLVLQLFISFSRQVTYNRYMSIKMSISNIQTSKKKKKKKIDSCGGNGGIGANYRNTRSVIFFVFDLSVFFI